MLCQWSNIQEMIPAFIKKKTIALFPKDTKTFLSNSKRLTSTSDIFLVKPHKLPQYELPLKTSKLGSSFLPMQKSFFADGDVIAEGTRIHRDGALHHCFKSKIVPLKCPLTYEAVI